MVDLRHSIPGREESLGRDLGVLKSTKEGQCGWSSKPWGAPKIKSGDVRVDNDCGVTGDAKQYQSLLSAYSGASPGVWVLFFNVQ